MANLTIPWPVQSSAFRERVVLEGVPYRLSFSWNGRGQYWSMTISNSNGVVLIAGIKLVLKYPLIGSFPGYSLPPGEMWVLRVTGDNSPVGRDELFTGEAKLVYVESE